MLGLIGEFTSAEEAVALKEFFQKLNCENFMINNYPIQAFQRSDYLSNRSIPEYEELDLLLLVGSNPKIESPLLNARILQGVKNGKLKVFKIGAPDDLGYKYYHLGNSTSIIQEIVDGTHPFSNRIKAAKNVHILCSNNLSNFLKGFNELYSQIQSLSKLSSKDCKITTGLLHSNVGSLSAYEVGIPLKSLEQI